MNAPTDDALDLGSLCARARAGDRAAYDEIFARHTDRALLFIKARLGPRLRAHVDSQDVLQESYLAAHRDFPRFEPAGADAFARWLFRIIENRIRDLGDRAGAQKRQPVALPAPSATGPGTAAERAEAGERLLRALDALPDDQREVLLLRYFEELPAEEAGRLLGRSAGAVRKLAARALVALGEALA